MVLYRPLPSPPAPRATLLVVPHDAVLSETFCVTCGRFGARLVPHDPLVVRQLQRGRALRPVPQEKLDAWKRNAYNVEVEARKRAEAEVQKLKAQIDALRAVARAG